MTHEAAWHYVRDVTRSVGVLAATALSVLLATSAYQSEEPPMPHSTDLATRLAAVTERGTLRITTGGRKTGKPHTVPIWFVVEGTTVYLGTLNVKRDWVRNLEKTPTATLAFDGLRLRGHISPVTDPALEAHIRELLAKKYWMAWIGSWFGKGPERTFRVDGLELAT